MANRFETGGPSEGEMRSPLERHRDKFHSEFMSVQNKHKELAIRTGYTHTVISSSFHESISISVDMFRGGHDFLIQEEERDSDRNPIYNKNMSISFTHRVQDAPVHITQVVRQPSGYIDREVTLDYGNLTGAGDVGLLDGQRVTTLYSGEKGVYKYSAAKKDFEYISGSGIVLSIIENKEDNSLVIREDPDSKGFTFPLKPNIYDELRKAEEHMKEKQLKRK